MLKVQCLRFAPSVEQQCTQPVSLAASLDRRLNSLVKMSWLAAYDRLPVPAYLCDGWMQVYQPKRLPWRCKLSSPPHRNETIESPST
ncbi:hypothetical protein BO443_290007 [Burkholderia orbicola]